MSLSACSTTETAKCDAEQQQIKRLQEELLRVLRAN